MKRIFPILLMAMIVLFSFTGCERIDAGHEGILIEQYGTDKGVQDVSLVTGVVFYNILTQDVVEFPVFMQTADYEPFSVNAKDGSIFGVDPMINYHVKIGQSPFVFSKYRKSIKELEQTVILTFVKDAFKNIFNRYTTDEILSRREEFDLAVTKLLTEELDKEGFTVEQITFGMRYPDAINASIEAKAGATQKAQQKKAELDGAKADAEILITRARAENEANRLRQQSLTPMLIQQQFIEKWDGTSSLYGSAPTLFKNVQ